MNVSGILSNPNFSLETIDHTLQKRIAGNLKDGNISADQAFSLEQGMQKINGMEREARSDGHTTIAEALNILHAQFIGAQRILEAAHTDPQPASQPVQPVVSDAPQTNVTSAPTVDVQA